MIDVQKIRDDFPLLSEKVNKYDLVYLDNAATSQKPSSVINATSDYYETFNSNVHRETHTISNRATKQYESARNKVAAFIGAESSKQVIFTLNTTDSINMIVNGFARDYLNPYDSVLVSRMEHHSNFVPWQQLCLEKNCNFVISEVDSNGYLDIDDFKKKLTPSVKIVSITQMSNVTGIINPIKELIELAHDNGSIVVIDGAQGIVHNSIDVKAFDCDFYCFSAHKIYAEMGLGVLYGKKELLEKTKPLRYGGGMVDTVYDNSTTLAPLPHKLEGGTPNVSSVISLEKALDYLENHDIKAIHEYERQLFLYAYQQLKLVPGINILGTGENQNGIISFYFSDISCLDVSMFLDGYGIAVRSGNHCAQPLLRALGLQDTVRISLSFYNTQDEIDYVILSLNKIIKVLRY